MNSFCADVGQEDSPVFVLSSGRCGSTLLQSILNTSPEFFIWGEHGGFLRQLAIAYFDTTSSGSLCRLDADTRPIAEKLRQLRDPTSWNAWLNPFGEPMFRESFRKFVRSFFAPPAHSEARWGFKEIRYGVESDMVPWFLHACFPKAQFIILVRNPVDTIFSYLSSWQRCADTHISAVDEALKEAASRWTVQYERLFLFHHSAGGRSCIVKYEQLHDHGTYAALAGFLGATKPFDYEGALGTVNDACEKHDEFASIIRERVRVHGRYLNHLTAATRALYSYCEGWQE